MGLLGCMAERLKDKLLTADRLVDVVAGPDAYRDLPRLFGAVTSAASADRDWHAPSHLFGISVISFFSMLRECFTEETTSVSYFCLFLLLCYCLPGPANLPSSC